MNNPFAQAIQGLVRSQETVYDRRLVFFLSIVSGAGREGAFLFEVRQGAAP
ncbi:MULTISPECIES: hypothetical protein [Dyella]|uniref:hypothetical protein n=1 Tax=Dyella TaxID=231454 RepID=UPI0018EC3828|nr:MULTISPECIES: hypothetical protein [Dyella]